MDAGENPATRYEAPANISADSKEPADVAYLNYLNAVMDKDAVEDTEKGETVVKSGWYSLYDSKLFIRKQVL